jgi:hypothetical protein
MGLLLVLIVLGVLFKSSRLYIASAWMVLIYSLFSIFYYSPDSYVYLLPALVALSVWMGLGSGWVVEKASQMAPPLKSVALLSFLAFFIGRSVLAIPSMNLSSDRKAEQYAQIVLDSAPANALIYTTGDEATFSLWYLNYAEHKRPDVAIVSSDLLIQPWYINVLKHTYPDLQIQDKPTEQGIISRNFHRPICRLDSSLNPILDCSSE